MFPCVGKVVTDLTFLSKAVYRVSNLSRSAIFSSNQNRTEPKYSLHPLELDRNRTEAYNGYLFKK